MHRWRLSLKHGTIIQRTSFEETNPLEEAKEISGTFKVLVNTKYFKKSTMQRLKKSVWTEGHVFVSKNRQMLRLSYSFFDKRTNKIVDVTIKCGAKAKMPLIVYNNDNQGQGYPVTITGLACAGIKTTRVMFAFQNEFDQIAFLEAALSWMADKTPSTSLPADVELVDEAVVEQMKETYEAKLRQESKHI